MTQDYHPPIGPNPPTVDFFFEVDCPFCRRVHHYILDKMEGKHKIRVNEVDVDENYGCEEMQWYRRFSREIEDEVTPVVRIATPISIYIFIMWKKKPTSITEEVLSSEEILEKKMYDRLRQMEKEVIKIPQQTYAEEMRTVLLEEVGIIA